jgi:prepilin-type N-terminal cleavage/methylation domain-containing protein
VTANPSSNPASRHEKHTRERHHQKGLTLIEILVTLVLLSILVFGLTGLWSNVSGHFLSLTLRQKAIFVLSGEMDRLSALYRFTNFGADAADSDYSTSPPAQQYGGPTSRKIYPLTSTNAPVVDTIVTQVAATFDCGTNDCAARIFHDANGAGSGDDRVYVWIDQARKITGRLSWVQEPLVSVSDSADCSDGVSTGDGTTLGGTAPCQDFTVYLEYPFRFMNGTTPDAPTGFDKIHQLSLKTIVGRRQ